jgi:hypothetical protein
MFAVTNVCHTTHANRRQETSRGGERALTTGDLELEHLISQGNAWCKRLLPQAALEWKK